MTPFSLPPEYTLDLPFLHPALQKTPLVGLGNKHWLYPEIGPRIRLASSGRFFEMFGGTFASAFNFLAQERRPIEMHLAETCQWRRLVLEQMRDQPERLIAALPPERSEQRVKDLRALLRTGRWTGEHPATYSALCLYVVRNSQYPVLHASAGFQHYKDTYRYDALCAQIRFFAPLLQKTTLYPDFRDMPSMRPGDFAFIDPPYIGTDCWLWYEMPGPTDLFALACEAFEIAHGSGADYLLTSAFDSGLLQDLVARGAAVEGRLWRKRAKRAGAADGGWGIEMLVSRGAAAGVQ